MRTESGFKVDLHPLYTEKYRVVFCMIYLLIIVVFINTLFPFNVIYFSFFYKLLLASSYALTYDLIFYIITVGILTNDQPK